MYPLLEFFVPHLFPLQDGKHQEGRDEVGLVITSLLMPSTQPGLHKYVVNVKNQRMNG